MGIPSHSQILDAESKESDRSDEEVNSSSQRRGEDPEWIPGSSYLQRKQNSDTDVNVAYRLRSRLVSRSEKEAARDKAQA